LATHTRLTSQQRRALRDVECCRTAALGGHVEGCAGCGHQRIAYNSCRNRHCPKCCASQQAAWLSREAKNLLPVEYYHVVFTLPSEVNPIGLLNPKTVYDALMSAAAETIREVAANPKHLGAEVGLLLVLHTWGQTLSYHPHVHGIATGGGLTPDGRWCSCRPGFFLPVRVLGCVFRGKFIARMREAFAEGKLAGFDNARALEAWVIDLQSRKWVVYSKPPFGGPAQVLKYLARYTHRVAIGNSRLVKLEAGRVTFTYKDYADASKTKHMTLDGVEFLRRWVQHVLPRGFVKIRHYGLLANRSRVAKLAVCRQLLRELGMRSSTCVPEPESRPDRCPVCGMDVWVIGERFSAGAEPRCGARMRVDTS
jgi:Putative transposase/Transposase zinc-binding domain